jgi:hypothetical protein
VALTVAALVPLGIGLAVGDLAGPGFPPAASVSAGGRRVEAAVLASCRGSGCSPRRPRGAEASSPPLLAVTRGARVSVRFAGSAAPVSVLLSTSAPGARSVPLAAANPTGFRARLASLSILVELTVRWRTGAEIVAVRLLVGPRHRPSAREPSSRAGSPPPSPGPGRAP